MRVNWKSAGSLPAGDHKTKSNADVPPVGTEADDNVKKSCPRAGPLNSVTRKASPRPRLNRSKIRSRRPLRIELRSLLDLPKSLGIGQAGVNRRRAVCAGRAMAHAAAFTKLGIGVGSVVLSAQHERRRSRQERRGATAPRENRGRSPHTINLHFEVYLFLV